jgi:adenine-specific DNA-methyltransferase
MNTPAAGSAPSLFPSNAPAQAAPPSGPSDRVGSDPSAAQATVTDTKFADLKAKLRELFELDKSDLDFGIYRIMAAKNKEVTEFLDRQLKDVVRETLVAHGAGTAGQVQGELDKLIANLRAAEMSEEEIAGNKKVVELRKKVAAAGGASSAELEADIYNHLLAFFGRYYDEGDFISKRRYKGDTYAIPYTGEEVALHWANKDQYYIKSGEWHKDYRFRLPGGKTVRFKLIQATQETNNNKERDDAKRRYVLAEQNPVEENGNELTLRFEFRTPTEAERTRAADKAVAIFGGKYAASIKGDEREQFCADSEKRALTAMSPAWATAVTQVISEGPRKSSTENKPQRTLLGKHLDEFTARNTFDYFIHKDLGRFLRRELDFYIKNEVVRLDDLEALTGDHLSRVQGKLKAIRRVSNRIIDFLASIEGFQKKMWLKKKLVLETNWLVTIDRVPPMMRDTVVANPLQWEEWERLGFKPKPGAEGLIEGPMWGTREYLNVNDKLVVDTRLFDLNFSADLIAEALIAPRQGSIDRSTTAVLIHAENFQALNLVRSTYRSTVQAIYIDPPYNTGLDGFIYKDAYQHSTWLSMYADRVEKCLPMLTANGILAVSIDGNEHPRANLFHLCDIKDFVRLGEFVWRTRNTDNRVVTKLSVDHEYVSIYSRGGCPIVGRTIDRSSYKNPDKDPRGPYTTDPLTGKANAIDRPNLHYVITNPATGDTYDPDPDFGWITDREGFEELLKDNRVFWPANPKTGKPRKKRFASEADDRSPASSLHISVTQSEGNGDLAAVMGSKVMNFPKPVTVPHDIADLCSLPNAIVCDFFAGSGTTGEAVFRLNREDGGDRRFLLIEMGEHFADVLRPRIAKVVYSPDWKDGLAQSHGKGISSLIKCFTLESYEDSLNNLPVPAGELLAQVTKDTKDELITYSLDLELGPNLMHLNAFRDPWGYTINARPPGDSEIRPHRVDLIETFNYLLGLKVRAYGPMERYSAEFEQAKHADGLGRTKVKGRLRRDKNGPFTFQRVEGEINDLQDTRVLVVWRKLTDNPDQDAAVLEAWMDRHREDTRERSEHRDYQHIYINGPVTLPQPTAEIRTVYPIEQTFKDRMFAETDEGLHG